MSLQIGKHLGREEDRATGSEIVAGIDDLLTEILLRVPVNSLLRFKSVSKHWLSLISNPQFCVLKSKRCCKHISGLLLKSDRHDTLKFKFVPLDHDDCPAPFRRLDFSDVVDCRSFGPRQFCNGLLLFRTKEFSSTKETKYFVINVTTKQHTAVSLPASAGKGFQLCSVALAFDPRISPHFKLICLFLCGDDLDGAADYCARIYSSETGLMTQLSDIFHAELSHVLSCAIYWTGVNTSDGLYFNVDEERFGILPRVPHYCRAIEYYRESNDQLFLVRTDTIFPTRFDVYEMDREYAGWFVRFHVDLQPIFRAFPPKSDSLRDDFSILAIVVKDGGGNSFIVLGISGKAMIRFNLEERVFTKICDFDAGDFPKYCWTDSIEFIESLHPL